MATFVEAELEEFEDEEHFIMSATCESDGRARELADDLAADWAMRQIAEAEREQAERVRAVEKRKATLDAWVQHMQERTESDTAFLRAALEHYARTHIQPDSKRQSIPLPSGALRLRKQPPTWRWPDKADPEAYGRFLAWCEGNGYARITAKAAGDQGQTLRGYARTEGWDFTAEPDLADLKMSANVREDGSVVDESGQVVPGVSVEPPGLPTFSFKIAEPEAAK